MRGWSAKGGSAVLGIEPTKWTQSAKPVFTKFAKLLCADPHKTIVDLLVALEEIDAPGVIEQSLNAIASRAK